eukprot:1207487-Amphidinium_carterae.2
MAMNIAILSARSIAQYAPNSSDADSHHDSWGDSGVAHCPRLRLFASMCFKSNFRLTFGAEI